MGRPRGKSKRLNHESDEDGSGGEEVSVSPTPPKTKRRRGRPAHKPLTADDGVEVEDDKDAGEVEEDDDDGAKPVPAVRPAGNDADDDAKGSTPETGAGKKRRRRRARVKRGSDDDDTVGEDGVGEGHVRAKSSGFRPNGSRRKSTPRRAAEAGVECK